MPTATRKCCYCKNRGRAEDMICVNGSWFHDLDAAVKYANEKATKQRKRQNRQAVKRFRDNDKKHQEKLTQIECNRLVVMLDAGKPCISCGDFVDLEAGHFRSVGSAPELRFTLLNIHGQCRACNFSGTRRMNRGKKPSVVAQEYETRLRERVGNAIVDWLQGPHQMPHYSCEELKIMRAMFTAEQRYFKEHGKPSRDWRKFPPLDAAA